MPGLEVQNWNVVSIRPTHSYYLQVRKGWYDAEFDFRIPKPQDVQIWHMKESNAKMYGTALVENCINLIYLLWTA